MEYLKKMDQVNISRVGVSDPLIQKKIDTLANQVNLEVDQYNSYVDEQAAQLAGMEIEEKDEIQQEAIRNINERTDLDGVNKYANTENQIITHYEDRRKMVPDKMEKYKSEREKANDAAARRYADDEWERAYKSQLEKLNGDLKNEAGQRENELLAQIDQAENKSKEELYRMQGAAVKKAMQDVPSEVGNTYATDKVIQTKRKKIMDDINRRYISSRKKQIELVNDIDKEINSMEGDMRKKEAKADAEKSDAYQTEQESQEALDKISEMQGDYEQKLREINSEKDSLSKWESELRERREELAKDKAAFQQQSMGGPGVGQYFGAPYGINPGQVGMQAGGFMNQGGQQVLESKKEDSSNTALQEMKDKLEQQQRRFWRTIIGAVIIAGVGAGSVYVNDSMKQMRQANIEQKSEMSSLAAQASLNGDKAKKAESRAKKASEKTSSVQKEKEKSQSVTNTASNEDTDSVTTDGTQSSVVDDVNDN